MSFEADILPFRNHPREFFLRLLNDVDSNFTELIPQTRRSRTVLRNNRCRWHMPSGPWAEQRRECNYSATITDKLAVKVLLISLITGVDRYLDYGILRSFAMNREISMQDSRSIYQKISSNAPGGAVCFLRNTLGQIAGVKPQSVPNTSSYNDYFSKLSYWDDEHCFGIIPEINRVKEILGSGGGSRTDNPMINLLRAATTFISNAQDHNVNVYGLMSGGEAAVDAVLLKHRKIH